MPSLPKLLPSLLYLLGSLNTPKNRPALSYTLYILSAQLICYIFKMFLQFCCNFYRINTAYAKDTLTRKMIWIYSAMKLKLFDIFGISLTLVWLDVFGPTGLHVKCYIIGSTQVSVIVDVDCAGAVCSLSPNTLIYSIASIQIGRSLEFPLGDFVSIWLHQRTSIHYYMTSGTSWFQMKFHIDRQLVDSFDEFLS